MAMFVPGMPGDQWANKRWEKTRLLILAIDAMQISYTTTCAIVEGLEAVGGGGERERERHALILLIAREEGRKGRGKEGRIRTLQSG